jgi:hypothetical protein
MGRRRRRSCKLRRFTWLENRIFYTLSAGVVLLALYVFAHALGPTGVFIFEAMWILAALAVCVLIWSYLRRMFIKYRHMKLLAWKYGDINEFYQIWSLTPLEIEEFVAYLYRKQGYKADTTPLVGDHGIDVELSKGSEVIKIQVKKYQEDHAVKESEVRDFFGSYSFRPNVKGIFVTTSRFSAPAREWGHARGIELIDGSRLAAMIKPEDVNYIDHTLDKKPEYRTIFDSR